MLLYIGTRLQIYEKLKNRIDFSTLFSYHLTLFNTTSPFRNYLALILVPPTETYNCHTEITENRNNHSSGIITTKNYSIFLLRRKFVVPLYRR